MKNEATATKTRAAQLVEANARIHGYESNAVWMLDSVRRRAEKHREIAASLRECGYLESADAYDREAKADESEVAMRSASLNARGAR